MFRETHDPVPGSNPPLFSHPAQSFITAAVRPHQEAARALPGFFGMTSTDRNAFGAVAMPERSLPQRPGQIEWNLEYARAGQIFDFPDTREQVRLTQPFCLKAYRRPIATGGVMLLQAGHCLDPRPRAPLGRDPARLRGPDRQGAVPGAGRSGGIARGEPAPTK